MLAGFLAGVSILYIPASRPNSLPLFIFAAVWAVGLADDVRSIRPSIRFCVHLAAGLGLWLAGWRLEWFRWHLLDLAATCLFVAFIINSMNLLDGMDGLAAGTSAIVCIGFLLVSAGGSSALEIAMACSLLGACLGMLTVNAPPARMFMGDSGSTFLGIVLAFLSLNWIRIQHDPHSILTPLIFLTLPMGDAMLAILRRTRSHQPFFDGDRRHYYDILLQRGWTVNRVLRVSVAVTGFLVLAGWLCARGIVEARITSALVFCCFAAGAYFLGSLQSDLRPIQTSPSETPLGSGVE